MWGGGGGEGGKQKRAQYPARHTPTAAWTPGYLHRDRRPVRVLVGWLGDVSLQQHHRQVLDGVNCQHQLRSSGARGH